MLLGASHPAATSTHFAKQYYPQPHDQPPGDKDPSPQRMQNIGNQDFLSALKHSHVDYRNPNAVHLVTQYQLSTINIERDGLYQVQNLCPLHYQHS